MAALATGCGSATEDTYTEPEENTGSIMGTGGNAQPTGGTGNTTGSTGSVAGTETGGGPSTGGLEGTGSTETGGTETGGNQPTGGNDTGGVLATGGDAGTGATESGGNPAGGTGGENTGGTPTGGTETGGNPAGGTGGTEPVQICEPGARDCQGTTTALECASDGLSWLETPCAFVCSAGSCTGECEPGTAQCSPDGETQNCNGSGQWETTQTCPFVCSNGACTGECEPGTTQCGLDDTMQTCSDAGEWEDSEVCEYVCSAGACTGSCEPDTTQCAAGGVVQTCTGVGVWEDTETCPYVCAAGACGGVCSPGDQDCQGDTPQSCDGSGQWIAGSECPYVCSGAGQCTGVCEPGTKRCASNGTTAQVCNSSGQWVTDQECPYVCSGAGVCSGVCEPGTTRCGSTEGTLQTCTSSGTWGDPTVCPGTDGDLHEVAACSNGSCEVLCEDGYDDCDGSAGNGCEADLTSDILNCRECGRDCGTDVAVYNRAASIGTDLAFDDNGYLYWGEGDEVWVWMGGSVDSSVRVATEPGTVRWLFPDGTGDVCWSALYQVATTYYGSINCASAGIQVQDIAGLGTAWAPVTADATNLYWVSGPGADLYKKARTGGSATIIGGPADVSLASSGSHIYWMDADEGGISRAAVGSSSGSLYVDTEMPAKMIVAGDSLVWLQTSNATGSWVRTLHRIDLNTDTSEVVVTLDGMFYGMGTDGDTLFWVDGSVMYSRSITGGPIQMVTFNVLMSRKNLAVDDQYVYWVTQYNAIWRVPKT